LGSTSRLSVKYEVILVTYEIEREIDTKQILINLSKNKENLTKIRLIKMNPKDDKGPASRRNLGALLAGSSILLFADDDAMILDDVKPLLEYLQTDKFQGVQPLIIRFEKPEIVDSAGDWVKKDNNLYIAYCRNAGLLLKDLPENLPTEEVPSLRSAFMLIKKEAFLAVGGFDSNYIFNFEDVDLGWRMTSAGYKLLFIPHIKAKHKGSLTTGDIKTISERAIRLSLLNTYATYLKINSFSLWLYILIRFERILIGYERTRINQRRTAYISTFKDFFLMNKLLIQRLGQARLHKNILSKKFNFCGRQKLEDMANGKRFIYQQ
jgi:GT2 family glycosyltransferase